MYRHKDERSVEAICYEQDHVQKVLSKIKEKFMDYINDFIELEAGCGISQKTVEKIAKGLGIQEVKIKKKQEHKPKI